MAHFAGWVEFWGDLASWSGGLPWIPAGRVLTHRLARAPNRGGLRRGTAGVCAAVEAVPAVLDWVVLGVEQPDGGYWMCLASHRG